MEAFKDSGLTPRKTQNLRGKWKGELNGSIKPPVHDPHGALSQSTGRVGGGASMPPFPFRASIELGACFAVSIPVSVE